MARKNDPIPFVEDVDVSEHEAGSPPTVTRGTITPYERDTFRQIFADIAARGVNKSQQPPVRRIDETGNDLSFGGLDVQTRSRPAQKREDAILQFPPSLRNAARSALDSISPGIDASQRPAAETEPVEIREAREEKERAAIARKAEEDKALQRELERVEKKLRAAQTDFELWDLMEEEVFSMVGQLGIADEKEDEAAQKKNKKKKMSRKLRQRGPLYPSYLLLSLRLLDTAFSRPSPLVLSVLPRIKELGLASYVLGVSTPFYNELLSIHWDRYGDISKVLELLEEMRNSGLYFNEQTAAVLKRMRDPLESCASGREGAFAQDLMTMPEYDKSVRVSVQDWLAEIQDSVRQRKLEM